MVFLILWPPSPLELHTAVIPAKSTLPFHCTCTLSAYNNSTRDTRTTKVQPPPTSLSLAPRHSGHFTERGREKNWGRLRRGTPTAVHFPFQHCRKRSQRASLPPLTSYGRDPGSYIANCQPLCHSQPSRHPTHIAITACLCPRLDRLFSRSRRFAPSYRESTLSSTLLAWQFAPHRRSRNCQCFFSLSISGAVLPVIRHGVPFQIQEAPGQVDTESRGRPARRKGSSR